MSIPAALLEAASERVPPLKKHGHPDTQVLQLLAGHTAEELFPGARAPQGALAGLLFYFDCWQRAHEVAQDDPSPEGSYWHAILHRQEPDPDNARYWLHRVGSTHPVQRQLAQKYGHSDPAAFVDLCTHARPGSDQERQALARQLEEWRLLYHYCQEPA